jgi:hypothetical protein
MKALFTIAFLAFASLAHGGDVQVTLHLIETSHAGMSAVLEEGLPDSRLFLRMRER